MGDDREQYVRETCKIGKGADCCRYLTMSASGWACEKGSPLQRVINGRVSAGEFTARGDNCAGDFGARQ